MNNFYFHINNFILYNIKIIILSIKMILKKYSTLCTSIYNEVFFNIVSLLLKIVKCV